MARKLIAVVALLALVSLASAGAALAETYNLNGGLATDVVYVEVYGDTGSGNPQTVPGTALGQFEGGYPVYNSYTDWKIARSENTNPGKKIAETPFAITYEVTYNQLMTGHGIGINGDGRFEVDTTEISFTSYDFVLTTTATYNKETQGLERSWYCSGETLYGEGHYYDNNTKYFFTLNGTLEIAQFNSAQHTGYINNLKIDVTPVPLPAGIWLLGTGLLGLACLGRRRRK